jgi:hypothetical protein
MDAGSSALATAAGYFGGAVHGGSLAIWGYATWE